MMARAEQRWHWTIYIGTHVPRAVEGIAIAGYADTIDDAKAAFRKSFDAMIAAAAVRFLEPP